MCLKTWSQWSIKPMYYWLPYNDYWLNRSTHCFLPVCFDQFSTALVKYCSKKLLEFKNLFMLFILNISIFRKMTYRYNIINWQPDSQDNRFLLLLILFNFNNIDIIVQCTYVFVSSFQHGKMILLLLYIINL